jgi:6-phosphogluconolactonase (cycloisomerase 2 family)
MQSTMTFSRSAARIAIAGLALLSTGLGFVPAALGQPEGRCVFIANNGNLEGSVTAFAVAEDGTLAFVNRIVTGTRPSMSDPCPGCNPYEISITPNGRYLATGHAATNDPMEQISVFGVGVDGAIEQIGAFSVTGTPMDVVWINDTYLAALRTDPSPDKVVVYRFDPIGPSLTEADVEDVGSFCAYLAVHPSQQYLYVNDSGSGRLIRVFAVSPDGTLTLIDTEPTGSYYGLELTLSHDGSKLYAAGGITSVVLGYAVAPDGALGPMASSPFPEEGDSPSNLICNPDDQYLLVGHGTDATLRSAAIDPLSGDLSYTGFVFDVGLQGTIGDVSVLDDLVFVTDNSSAIDGLMGIYSFTLEADGSFTQNAPIYPTGGIAPRSVAVWGGGGSGAVTDAARAGQALAVRVSPNPFWRTVDIAFRLPGAGPVTVDVLDVNGRTVRQLLDRCEPAGERAIGWDGSDDAGQALPSGIYFARIRTEAGDTLQRIALLR